MLRHIVASMEHLEARRLLAHFAADPEFGGDLMYAQADGTLLVAPLTGGKVLAVGEYEAVRLAENGSTDGSFKDRNAAGLRGSAAVVVGQALFIAGVDRVEGEAEASIFVRKINLSTGAASAGFGTDGVARFVPTSAVVDVININEPRSMIATPDGGLILAVPIGGLALVLHKIDADGNTVTTFGHNGTVVAEDQQQWPVETGHLAPADDGRFVLLGGNELEPLLKRFNADGSIDTDFGNQGAVALAGEMAPFAAPLVQPDGKALVPYVSRDDISNRATASLTRYNADGTRDTDFGAAGVVRLLEDAAVCDLVLDSGGRIIGFAGSSDLFRLTPAGALDPLFDDDGFATAPPQLAEPRVHLALDEAGRILIGRPDVVNRVAERVDTAELRRGRLMIDGTEEADTIMASLAGDQYLVNLNGREYTFPAADVLVIDARSAGGDDRIDLPVNVRTVVMAGGGDDWIRAGGGNDQIYGWSGNDSLEGGDGRDALFGGDDHDSLWGGAGKDKLLGEGGNDSLSGGDDMDTLYGGNGDDSLSGNAGVDALMGDAGDDRVAGNGGHDWLFGSDGNDRLFGGAGDDRLYGGASGDRLYAGIGADQLFGEGGPDRLHADDDEPAGAIDVLHGNAGDDVFFTRDTLADQIFGYGGHDTATDDEIDLLSSIEVVA